MKMVTYFVFVIKHQLLVIWCSRPCSYLLACHLQL